YLNIFFRSPVFIQYVESVQTGIAYPAINDKQFFGAVFPLPPIAEQHRIVAKVDELMALCDQLEQRQTDSITGHQTLVETLLNALVRPEPDEEGALTATNFDQAWQRITEHFDTLFTTEHSIDQLKQTILQLAVMGKLVSQNPVDEPVSVLLEKIAKEKARLIKEGKIKKQKSLPQITKEQKPYNLPDGWLWIHLPDIGELARGKSKHRPRNDPKLYIGGATPMVQTGDVARADSIVSTYTALYNQKGVAQSRLWPRGTMCITIAANIADTGILGFEACFPDSIVGFIPFDKKINVKYFEYFIRTAKEHLEDFAPSTAQKNINLEILSKLLVPMPPANELTHIVSKVEELMTICDTLKTRLQEAQTTQVHLADAIVKQAVA
ncbi:MAG TPA: restriction endonuclease subunit S, partial [Gammaproteobacteria bacterium]|nr:restriction endonuclease subunit S [Gammaproteobacteria bacterium]